MSEAQKTEDRRQKTEIASAVLCSMAELDRPKADGSRRILVLGLGNILLRDEGVGAHVAQVLQEKSMPVDVEVVDGGTAALDALLLAQRAEKLIVIDALKAGGKPGTIYKAKFLAGEKDKLAEILAGQTGSKISLHQVGLIDALAVAERLNCVPEEITIIGVEPAEVRYGLELTDEVERKIPEIIDTVLKEIEDAVHRK